MEDYEEAFDYFHQALRADEKVLEETHPDTLSAIVNMASTYQQGVKDFAKAEELYRFALDGFEKSLGKDHEETKNLAMGLTRLHVVD